MIAECPHCHARVLFSSDGRCPACQKRPDEPGASPHLTRIALAAGEPLPTICASCGCTTDRKQRYVHVDDRGRKERRLLGTLFAVAGLLNPVFWIGLGTLDRIGPSLRIDIRRCGTCASQPTVPLYVDFGRNRMLFLVHRRFAEAILELRGRPRASVGAVSPVLFDGALSRIDG